MKERNFGSFRLGEEYYNVYQRIVRIGLLNVRTIETTGAEQILIFSYVLSFHETILPEDTRENFSTLSEQPDKDYVTIASAEQMVTTTSDDTAKTHATGSDVTVMSYKTTTVTKNLQFPGNPNTECWIIKNQLPDTIIDISKDSDDDDEDDINDTNINILYLIYH
ncbi:hypothetical protein HELRODRAFT_183778 [Helobdella robusta]|uniref:Uncharacterized protein n=1 Tax=Helobdella robusta TaxID=6412 RepID=T1FK65_HELRO|nr:hypothetical protein HELRODRAFT_183778 [Helobdella robusta]ESO10311.1 hypothetical protein HELRODRAFT_183778 [Helobdella robusta]